MAEARGRYLFPMPNLWLNLHYRRVGLETVRKLFHHGADCVWFILSFFNAGLMHFPEPAQTIVTPRTGEFAGVSRRYQRRIPDNGIQERAKAAARMASEVRTEETSR
jgi:hypothetical protein